MGTLFGRSFKKDSKPWDAGRTSIRRSKDMQKENIGTPSKGSKLSKCVGKFVVLVQKKMWRDMLYEVE